MKIDLETPGATNTTKPAAEPSKEPTAEQSYAPLEQLPHKRDVAAVAPELMTPQSIALINSLVAAAVKEAVGAAMGAVVPALQKISEPSPLEVEEAENLARLKERFKREKTQMMSVDEETRQNKLKRQKSCSHKDQNEKSCIALMHCGYPDRQVRGMCLHCHKLIQPRHYETANPGIVTLQDAEKFIAHIERTEGIRGITPFFDEKLKRVTHLLYPADPLYPKVLELEIASTAGN